MLDYSDLCLEAVNQFTHKLAGKFYPLAFVLTDKLESYDDNHTIRFYREFTIGASDTDEFENYREFYVDTSYDRACDILKGNKEKFIERYIEPMVYCAVNCIVPSNVALPIWVNCRVTITDHYYDCECDEVYSLMRMTFGFKQVVKMKEIKI